MILHSKSFTSCFCLVLQLLSVMLRLISVHVCFAEVLVYFSEEKYLDTATHEVSALSLLLSHISSLTRVNNALFLDCLPRPRLKQHL